PDLIPRSIAAFQGGQQERLAFLPYLITLASQTADEPFRLLLVTLQQALIGMELSQLGQNLTGNYKDAWEAILRGIKAEKE
ncbi:MAG TPA: hypothetical protein VFN35_33775, partial [Ktedonobacteraceae bacterium]|nr:hypothetical protein [Ktedonobacteraceae bacterium]